LSLLLVAKKRPSHRHLRRGREARAIISTVTLQASPASINKGESSTLSWNSTDATQLSIAPDVGAVTAQGSTKVSPSDTTTYTVTATGPGGSASATATVSVNAPPPPPPPQIDLDKLFLQEVRDAYFDFDKADIVPTLAPRSPRPLTS